MERRFYKRDVVNLLSNFIVAANEPGKREFYGNIKDVSEGGIKIEVLDEDCNDIVNNLAVGDIIQFQSVDEYEMFGEVHTDVFYGEVEVLRITKLDTSVELGCKLTKQTSEFLDYMQNRKVAQYLKTELK